MMSQTNVPMTPTRRVRESRRGSCCARGRSRRRRRRRPPRRVRPARCGQASHAGLKARRRTSARSGTNRSSPACGHAAGEHDHVGIEDVQQVGDAGAEQARRLPDDLAGESIALDPTAIHGLRRDGRVSPPAIVGISDEPSCRAPPGRARRWPAPTHTPRGSHSCRSCSAVRCVSIVMWPTSPATSRAPWIAACRR